MQAELWKFHPISQIQNFYNYFTIFTPVPHKSFTRLESNHVRSWRFAELWEHPMGCQQATPSQNKIHMKKHSAFVTGLVLTALAASAIAQRAPQRSQQLAPATVVSESLTEALTGPSGEYAAYAAYQAVILKFGKIQPFVSIMDAEAKHIAALQTQMQKYGMAVPANSWLGTITAPATVTDAALLGVAAEKSNAVMYDQLLLKVKAYPDLVRVFGNLEGASLGNHLPAFEAAATGDYTDATCTTCPTTCPQGPQRGKKR
jgi:hypothetical protein